MFLNMVRKNRLLCSASGLVWYPLCISYASTGSEYRCLAEQIKFTVSVMILHWIWQLHWLTLKRPLPFLSVFRMVQHERYGTLIVANSTAADTGEYTCFPVYCEEKDCRKIYDKAVKVYIFFSGTTHSKIYPFISSVLYFSDSCFIYAFELHYENLMFPPTTLIVKTFRKCDFCWHFK